MVWDFFNDVVLRHSGEAIMAWVQFIPLIISAAASIGQTAVGASKEKKQRNAMDDERKKWKAENEGEFNAEYYSDYTKRADVQNIIRQMREEMKRQARSDIESQAVLGTTQGAIAANKERRNRAMADLYGNLAAQGQLHKDKAKDRYLSRKYGLQGMEYDTMGQQAQSYNNLMYNGINGLASLDWAGVLSGKGGKGGKDS